MPLDVLLVRDDDIPDLVRKMSATSASSDSTSSRGATRPAQSRRRTVFEELQTLDFGVCRLSLAVPEATSYSGPEFLVASASPRLPEHPRSYLTRNGRKAEIVSLSGAVEIAPRLGRADLICDLVSSDRR